MNTDKAERKRKTSHSLPFFRAFRGLPLSLRYLKKFYFMFINAFFLFY